MNLEWLETEEEREDPEQCLGSREDLECQEELERLQEERERLERKLRDAQSNLKNSQKALEQLERDKAAGMIGVDPAISNREYQIRVYTKDISDLERQINGVNRKISSL